MKRKLIRWTQEEVDYLKWNYPKLKIIELQLLFYYRTIKSIERKIQNLGLNPRRNYWNKKEIDYLKKNYGKVSNLIICNNLGRSLGGVYAKAENIGLRSKIRFPLKLRLNGYSEKEDEIIKKYWGKLQAREIKQNFPVIFKKRSLMSIRRRVNRLGLYSKNYSNFGLLNGMFKKNHSEKSKKVMRNKQLNLWRNEEYAKKQIKSFHLKPTLPEKQVMQIIKLNKLPFNYTGDGKVILGGFCPDFLSKNPKYIIEVNGEYWHRDKKRELRKKKAYNLLGYELLVIWSKELQTPQKVTERIINFYSTDF